MIPELPKGWVLVTAADAGAIQLGRQRSPKNHRGSNMKPYLRVANVFEDRIDTSDLMQMHFEPEEYERYRLVEGDVLLNEGQSPELLGRPAIYRGVPEDVAFTNSLIRFQAHDGIVPEWSLIVFRHHMHSGRFARESRITTNIAHLSAKRFATTEFPVPPEAEQRRIVVELERRLSHVEAAERGLAMSRRKLLAARASLEHHLLWRDDAPRHQLGDLLRDGLANGRSVKDRAGGFPVLRLTSLKDGAIDVTETKEGAWTRDEAEGFLIEAGDFLVSRGNGSLALVGRGGLVAPNPPEIAYPDTLIRVRVDADRLLPEYLSAVWNSHGVREQLERMARTTAGIYKVNQDHLRSVSLPVPDTEVQRTLLEELDQRVSIIKACAHSVDSSVARCGAVRRSLLATAFSGRLVPQDPDDEPADVLVERLRAERAAEAPKKKTRARRNKEAVA